MALLAAALSLALILGVAVLLVDQSRDRVIEAREHPADPLTDDAAAAQVIDAAVDAVTTARLQRPAGGYAFLSCTNASDPPYQVVAYLTFLLPPVDSVGYLDDVAAAMLAHGWSDSATSGEHFGGKLTREGVTTVMHRNPERADLATMRIYGECRVTGEHAHDDPAWTELTGRLRRPS